MQHLGGGLVPARRVLLHGLEGDFLQPFRNRGVQLARGLGVCLQLHDGDGDRVVRLKREAAGQHLVQHHADGIQIRLFIRKVAARLLGGDIMDGADGLVGHGPRFVAGEARNAEIRDLDGAVLQQHDVLRLDVAVDDALAVGMLQGAQNLDGEVDGFLPFDDFLLVEVFLQGNAVDILFDDILDSVAEAHVVDLDDVGVGEDCDRLGFVAEAAEELLVSGKFILQDFDGHRPVVDGIVGTVHHRHSSDADDFMDFVAAVQPFSRVSIHTVSLLQAASSSRTTTVMLSPPPALLARAISCSVSWSPFSLEARLKIWSESR